MPANAAAPEAAMDRIAPTRRPSARAVGTQKWRSLLFVHWEVRPEALRPLVPDALAIDTFEGRAYVGLVAFGMREVRPSRFLPALPTAANFEETNVRTYVHAAGRDPGVWFFSLDASSALAVLGARAFYHLPYWHARMAMESDGDGRTRYRSDRHWEEGSPASLDVRYERGEELAPVAPGSLEHFLVERYLLYAVTARGALLCGQVHHRPYPLRRARVIEMSESLVAAAGVVRPQERASELWSEGVDVEIFGLTKCGSPRAGPAP
jgi:uncharacterized protein YqjF (DUF2071 family)